MSAAKALKEFHSGDVEAAQRTLDEAAKSTKAAAELLDVQCLRATLAAMKGSTDVTSIISQLPPGEAARLPVQSYLEGIAAMARGDLTTASRHLETAVDRCEGFAAAMVCLAAAYYLTGHYERSYKQYCDTLKLLGSKQTPPVVRVGMGLCAFRLHRPVDARRILERAVAVNPDDELAWLGLLVVYIELRMLSQVHTTVAHLKHLMPENPTVLLKVCDLMYFRALEEDRVKGTMSRLRELLTFVRQTASPEEAALADFQEGRLLLAYGDVTAAQPFLEAAVRANPNLLAARIHYARLLLLTHRERDAEALLREMHDKNPHEKEVLQMLALIATRAARHGEALRYSYTLTMAVAQGDVYSWALASVCSRLDSGHCKRLCSRVQAIQRELKLPQSWQLSANLAILSEDVEALQGIVDVELGAGFLLESVGVDVAYVPLLFNLALLRERIDVARARQLYVYLVKHHATFKAPYYRLHFLAKAAGQLRQAMAWLQWLLLVYPREPTAQTCLAQLYLETAQPNDALKILERAHAAKRQLPVALAVGATSLQACQRSSSQWPRLLESARASYAAALMMDPRNILAAHGYACCDGIEGSSDAAESMLNSVSEVTSLSPIPPQHVDAHRANVKMQSQGYKQAADYFVRMATRTAEQEAMFAYCIAREGQYTKALALMASAAMKAPGEEPMLIYNTALLHFMAFVDGLMGARSLTDARGKELLAHLEAGLQGFSQLDGMKSTNEAMRTAKRNLRSISAYCEHHRATVLSLVETGRSRAAELVKAADGWRGVFSSHVAEQRREEVEKVAAAQQRAEEQRMAENAVYTRFQSSGIRQPDELLTQELMMARVAEAYNHVDTSMERGEDLPDSDAMPL